MAADKNATSFPVPFSKEEFQTDLQAVFLHCIRSIAWMTDAKTAWAITGAEALVANRELMSPEYAPEDLGLTYASIEHTEFVRTMEFLYDFGFHGRLNRHVEQMGDESIHAWITALVCDVHNSSMADQWDAYGVDVHRHSGRCVHVAEIANARHMLEGGESIYSQFPGTNREEWDSEGYLTVRQLALLSGMEEMSVRAAANPKRPHPLKTVSVDGGTRIDIDVAKEWLMRKGRYVPIVSYWPDGDIDLQARSFAAVWELDTALNGRYQSLQGQHQAKKDELTKALSALGIPIAEGLAGPYLDIPRDFYHDPESVRRLGAVLSLSPELLVLRAQEASANEALAVARRRIRELTSNQ